ncbi:MAG: hypothetical protein IJT62_08695 [Oscillospiraceae bacterium]|nr:hypothetical protein [Oscillospiraceae bacterium]
MEFKTKDYIPWDEYLAQHPEIKDVEGAKKLQEYEDAVFSFMMRLFR